MRFYTVIPFGYFIKTRLNSKVQKVSWLFTYFLPVGFLYFQWVGFTLDKFGLLLVDLIIFNYVYENGYIQNDVKTVQAESKPTLRLQQEDFIYIKKHYNFIFAIRVAILFFLIVLHFVMANLKMVLPGSYFFYSNVIFLQLFFVIYNNNRNLFNLILVLPMNQLRFWGVAYLYVGRNDILFFTACTLTLYPLLKFLEFTTRKRFNLKWMDKFLGNLDFFRIRYYLFSTIFFAILNSLYSNRILQISLHISMYYLIYRMITWLWVYKIAKVSSDTKRITL